MATGVIAGQRVLLATTVSGGSRIDVISATAVVSEVMTELQARLRNDLAAARKARDKGRTVLLSTVLSDINNRALELARAASEEESAEVIRKGIRKRREAHDAFDRAGRTDLADKERWEAATLEAYLPAQMSDEEIRAVVRRSIADGNLSMGAVMGGVVPELRGRAEGARINAIVREELAARH